MFVNNGLPFDAMHKRTTVTIAYKANKEHHLTTRDRPRLLIAPSSIRHSHPHHFQPDLSQPPPIK
ncbi:MAG: hypothetical protein ACR2H5_06840 [Ktedonobacteraceae bacterium]